MYITGSDLRLHRIGRFSGESGDIMEAGDLPGQLCHFASVERIPELTASEDQVYIPVGDVIIEDMIAHGTERCDAGAGANKEEIFFYRVGKREYALRTAKGQFAADVALVEEVIRAGPAFEEYDHELDDVGAVGPGCDGVTTDAFVYLLMDREIERYELARFEIEGFLCGYLDPEPPGLR